MDRLKVLNKANIIQALKEGCTMDYHGLEGKVYIKLDGEKIGAVRFDTYLKLGKELNLKQKPYYFLYDSYYMEVENNGTK